MKSVPMIHHGHFQNVCKWKILGKMAISEMTKMYAGTDFSASNHLGGPQRMAAVIISFTFKSYSDMICKTLSQIPLYFPLFGLRNKRKEPSPKANWSKKKHKSKGLQPLGATLTKMFHATKIFNRG